MMINSPYTRAHLVWLEGAGATSLNQIGGYANLIGAPTWSTDAPFADAGSIVLDGATQYVTIPSILACGPREFTVALRYNPTLSLPDVSDRRIWSITGRDDPEETLDVLWRGTSDAGGYLWVRCMQGGVLVADVVITTLEAPPGLWTSVVVTAGVAGLYVYHNGVKVGGRSDFPWPAFKGGIDHDFTLGNLSSSPLSFLPASVGEFIVEHRIWTDQEVLQWHAENTRYSTEHGKWLKNCWNPTLVPQTKLEQGSLQEPNLLYENGIYKLWYTQGFDKEAIAYAISDDGLTWTKYAFNPVLGHGRGGEPYDAARGYVVKVADTYYLFYNSSPNPPATGDEKLATSSDGIHWTSEGVILRTTDWPWGGQFGNVSVWVEGNTWYMLFEALYHGSGVWEMGAATSQDGRNWNLLSHTPLRSMQIADQRSYGGPMVVKRDGRYHCWYHATPKSSLKSSFIPTAIYRATSLDLLNWEVYSTIPVLSLTQQYEIDQIADPTFLEVNGRCLMMFDGMNNSPPGAGSLGLATFNGCLDELLRDGSVFVRRSPPTAALELLLLR